MLDGPDAVHTFPAHGCIFNLQVKFYTEIQNLKSHLEYLEKLVSMSFSVVRFYHEGINELELVLKFLYVGIFFWITFFFIDAFLIIRKCER